MNKMLNPRPRHHQSQYSTEPTLHRAHYRSVIDNKTPTKYSHIYNKPKKQ